MLSGGMDTNTMPPALYSYLDSVLISCLETQRPLITVGVSGGSDSMALALLLHAWCKQRQGRIIALSVDHGLRPESAQECEQIAQWMDAHGIAHRILKAEGLQAGSNLQSRARDARYGALIAATKRERAESLCIAHHAEDQAETVLLQRHRGTSPTSRSGMPLVTWRDGVRLVRPLLGVRKSMLRAYLLSRDQLWIEDPSNLTDHYARNRIRRTMSDDDVRTLWHEAQTMGEERNRDDQRRNAWLASYSSLTLSGTLALFSDAWRALDTPERTDILSRAIQFQGGNRYRPRLHETVRLDRRIMESTSGKATLGHTVILWSEGEAIRITPEPSHAASTIARLDVGGHTPHMGGVEPSKSLVAPPFWWFNSSPYF